ncbi:MAG: hypothetical protein OZ921_20790, partial [Sorangiineae bacterium]|nr:hypothetical protein [Sorangiineae bacterium]
MSAEGASAAAVAPPVGAALGEGLLLGTAAACVAAVPAALRAGAGVSPGSCWLVAAGGVALALGPLTAALRVLRPWPARAAGVPLGLLVALAPMMVLGKLLKTTTHHRPLGGATFAMLAVGLVLGGMAVAARLVAWSRSDAGRARGLARLSLIALAVLSGLAALALGRAAFGAASGGVGAGVLQGAFALALAAGASLAPVPAALARSARLAGPTHWVLVAL